MEEVDRPSFVDSNQQSLAEQPLPPRRKSSRKRPPPTPEAGGRKSTSSKRHRDDDDGGDDGDEVEALAPVDERRPADPPPARPAAPSRRRDEAADSGRAARQRTMSAVKRARSESRREVLPEDEEDDDDDEKKGDEESAAPQPQDSRRWWPLWVVVATWCVSWVAIGARAGFSGFGFSGLGFGRRLWPADQTAQLTYRHRALSELRGTEAWKAHEAYRRELGAFRQGVDDVADVGREAAALLATYEARRDRLDALVVEKPKDTGRLDVDHLLAELRRATGEAAAAANDATRAASEATATAQAAAESETALLGRRRVQEKIDAFVLAPEKNAPAATARYDDAEVSSFLSRKTVVERLVEAASSAARARAADARSILGALSASRSSSSSSSSSKTLDEKAISDFVAAKLDEALRADETFDYASLRTGGEVLFANTSRDYARSLPLRSVLFSEAGRPPTTVVGTTSDGSSLKHSGDLPLGACWAFAGRRGVLALKLAEPTKPTKFAILHARPEAIGFGDISSAPKTLQLLGFPTLFEGDGAIDLGTFTFDFLSTATITQNAYRLFRIPKTPPVDLVAVKLIVLDNHGNANYTCLYRFALYSTPPELT